MNKEQKVTSRPLAKELQKVAKENGFELPESEYMWSEQMQKIVTREWFLAQDPYNQDKLQDDGFRQSIEEIYNLYDTSELGMILPEKIKLKTHCMGQTGGGVIMELCFGVDGKYNKFWIAYGKKGIVTDHRYFEAKTEAEARGKMLVYLICNKLI